MELNEAISAREETSHNDDAEPSQPSKVDTCANEDSGSKRDSILKAAVDEFLQYGYAGARVDRIARAAKANKQLIYYHFGNKLGLLDTVLSYLIDRSREQQLESGFDNLEEVVKSLALPTGAGVLWRRYWLWEALERKNDGIMQEEARRKVLEGTTNLVRSEQDAGKIDPKFDAEMLSLALFSMTAMPNVLPQFARLITGTNPNSELFRERQMEFIGQLLASVAPPSHD
ncbi:TetR/AcrR family transcriptional regulator [Rhodococcus koreensis]